jgi:hypothetical protein
MCEQVYRILLIRIFYRIRRQRKNLNNGWTRRDQVFGFKTPPDGIEFTQRQAGLFLQRRLPVLGHTITVRDNRQKEVERPFVCVQRGVKSIVDETVRDKTEAAIDATDPSSVDNRDKRHNSLL